jgi:Fe-S-cluster containining protein
MPEMSEPAGDQAAELTFDLERSSGFRYTCNRCTRCCHHKRIMLNPYELLRLAGNRGISVQAFIRDFTTDEGTVLKFEGPEDSCVFLGPEGCSVHPDRPLVCRLYPLGRYVPPAGGEAFAILEGHPESAGVFTPTDELGPRDTVGEFLVSQRVDRHIRAAERYYALYTTIAALAHSEDDSDDGSDGPYGEFWLHADTIASAYCREQGMPEPPSAEAQMEAHIAAVTLWARRRSSPEQGSSEPLPPGARPYSATI